MVGNSWFKKNNVYKYMWLRMAEERAVDKALMDYVLPRQMLGRLLDVKMWRGEGGGLSDHFLVEALLKLGGWRSAGTMEGVRKVLKVSELNSSVKERAYQESLRGKYEVWRGGEVMSMENKWKKFRDIVMECTNDVCVMRHAGRQRRKGSEWWNEVGRVVAEKRRAFKEWFQRRDRVTYDRYRAQRVVVKQGVHAAKRMVDQ